IFIIFFFQAEDGIRDRNVTGVQTCALPIYILRYSEDGKEALNYLTERGISTETIDQFHIGFSPNIDGFILDFLEKKGFHKQFLRSEERRVGKERRCRCATEQ